MSLARARSEAAACRRCDLWKRATQTVFGEGPARARVMLVGEQPGNEEDRDGHPFVGPAGKLLDRALSLAKLDRREVYVTNAVKHFKWTARGRWRIHKTPSPNEVRACRFWLELEIRSVAPDVLVCLGSTAAQALLGREFRVSTQRGALVESPLARFVTATVHPSSVLRAPDPATRHRELERLVEDLRKVAAWARRVRRPPDRRGIHSER